MAETSPEELEIEDLERQIHLKSEQRETLRLEQDELAKRKDSLMAMVAARKKVATMSDAERAAMVQAIQLDGVGSEEAVGAAST